MKAALNIPIGTETTSVHKSNHPGQFNHRISLSKAYSSHSIRVLLGIEGDDVEGLDCQTQKLGVHPFGICSLTDFH